MEEHNSKHSLNLSYDQFFQQHYDIVRCWALKITAYDRELSEDILHDVYLRLNQKKYDTADVQSIEGYLYIALKNAYVSYLRKKLRSSQISLIENEFVDNIMLAVDPRRAMVIHDHLRAVCHYACRRKATSISGSILILRFFHGYFPDEVARLVKRSSNAVEARLMTIRREVGIYLQNPSKFDVVSKTNKTKINFSVDWLKNHYDLFDELREKIFKTKSGKCLPFEDYLKVYQQNDKGLGCKLLSHLVSCENCLNAVSRLLGLRDLIHRHPLETLGRKNDMELPGLVKGVFKKISAFSFYPLILPLANFLIIGSLDG